MNRTMRNALGVAIAVGCMAAVGAALEPPARAGVPVLGTRGQQAPGGQQESAPAREPDVVFVPTPEQIVGAMLELAEVGPSDVVYDLGSGDGRIPIAAARDRGARAVGIDINPERISEARANAEREGVTNRVEFRQGDLFETDISRASVVTLYLLPSLNEKLRPKLLAELAPGTRIVSHAFAMGDWKPEREILVQGTTVYLWRVPQRQQ